MIDGLEGMIHGAGDEPHGVPGFWQKVHTHANPKICNDPTNPISTLNVNVFQNISKFSSNDKSSIFKVAVI